MRRRPGQVPRPQAEAYRFGGPRRSPAPRSRSGSRSPAGPWAAYLVHHPGRPRGRTARGDAASRGGPASTFEGGGQLWRVDGRPGRGPARYVVRRWKVGFQLRARAGRAMFFGLGDDDRTHAVAAAPRVSPFTHMDMGFHGRSGARRTVPRIFRRSPCAAGAMGTVNHLFERGRSVSCSSGEHREPGRAVGMSSDRPVAMIRTAAASSCALLRLESRPLTPGSGTRPPRPPRRSGRAWSGSPELTAGCRPVRRRGGRPPPRRSPYGS
ncbi:hypothetical protein SGLAM104S_09753 [Streptomyces glaucescens]